MTSVKQATRSAASTSLLRLAATLFGQHRRDELLDGALEILASVYPGTTWVMLEQVSARGFRAVSRDYLSREDAGALAALACPDDSVLDVRGLSPSAFPFARRPLWCAWPGDATSPQLVLGVWADPGYARPEATALAASLELVAKAWANAPELDRLREPSTTDPLTGVSSRRATIDALAKEQALAARRHEAMAVLYVDVDASTRLNEVHGVRAGDHALRALGQTIRQAVRSSDIVGRIGGDEFLVILPRTDLAAARRVVRAIEEQVRATAVHVGGLRLSLGVTVGISSSDAGVAGNIVHLADFRMPPQRRVRATA